MFYPVCQQLRCKKEWRSSQWSNNSPCDPLQQYDRCKVCDPQELTGLTEAECDVLLEDLEEMVQFAANPEIQQLADSFLTRWCEGLAVVVSGRVMIGCNPYIVIGYCKVGPSLIENTATTPSRVLTAVTHKAIYRGPITPLTTGLRAHLVCFCWNDHVGKKQKETQLFKERLASADEIFVYENLVKSQRSQVFNILSMEEIPNNPLTCMKPCQ